MTKVEAREYALRLLAAEARHHVANGSEWMEIPHGAVAGASLDSEGHFSEADQMRIREAVEKVALGMSAASIRLARSRVRREARKLMRRAQRGSP